MKMDPQALDSAIESALTRLGYENLRPMQKLAVQSFIQGRDVFVSLPLRLPVDKLSRLQVECCTKSLSGCSAKVLQGVILVGPHIGNSQGSSSP